MNIIDRRYDITESIAICIFPPVTLRHQKLQKKMTEFTEFYVKRMVEILPTLQYHKVQSIDVGMELYHNKYEHIIFLACGVRIFNESILYDLIDLIRADSEADSRPYLAGAHVLDWGSDWYELHNQFILVNSRSWLDCDKPVFGDFTPGVDELPIIERSKENFHDGYTPLWIKPTGKYKKTSHCKQGWNYINVAFRKNYKIFNWPKHIRDKRTYYYPESDSDKFYHCLINRKYDSSLNANQKKLLKVDKDVDKHVWILNTERIDLINPKDIPKCNNIEKLILPASGLKFLSAFKQDIISKSGEFVFYDFSQNSLDWINFIHKHDSYDLPEIAMDFSNKKFLKIQGHTSIVSHTGEFVKDFWTSYSKSLEALGGVSNYYKYLDSFRGTKVSLVKCNLLEEQDKLIPYFHSNKNLFSVSNIFCTDYSNIFLEKDFLNNSFKRLISKIPQDTYITGFTPDAKFFSNNIFREKLLLL